MAASRTTLVWLTLALLAGVSVPRAAAAGNGMRWPSLPWIRGGGGGGASAMTGLPEAGPLIAAVGNGAAPAGGMTPMQPGLNPAAYGQMGGMQQAGFSPAAGVNPAFAGAPMMGSPMGAGMPMGMGQAGLNPMALGGRGQQEAGPAREDDPMAAARSAAAAGMAPPPAPLPARSGFARALPSLGFGGGRCAQDNNDPLSALVTKCQYLDKITSCAQLAESGVLPQGVHAYEAPDLTGTFSVPMGCSSGSIGLSYDARTYRMTFNAPQTPVLAVITKDKTGSMVSFMGTGSTQGRVKHRDAMRAEFCYAPGAGEVGVTQTAVYSTGMQPGSATWSFSKSVQLAAPYSTSRAVMFNGDSVDATWTLSAQKTGSDVSYQGVVSGSISINNPTPGPLSVTSVVNQIPGGPTATVACPSGLPFYVPACSFVTCQYTAYYPHAPAAGTYTGLAQVQYKTAGGQSSPAYAQGSSIFNVGSASALSALSTSAGAIPGGAALVTDPGSPQGNYTFTGPGVHSYVTRVVCDAETSGSGAISSTATLTGSNGQQITQSATIQKQCYDLQVAVASRSTPRIGRWAWHVRKTASPGALTLKPAQGAVPSADRMMSFSRDYSAATTGEVMFSVTYSRSAPTAAAGTAAAPDAAFEATGDVYIRNPAPINARLQSLVITVSSASGGQPYVTQATCPSLVVPAGQRMTCTWRATPTFNPLGQQVRATARLVNTHNGQSQAGTSDFSSAPATIGGDASMGEDDGGAAAGPSRRLQQTWGGGLKAHGLGAFADAFAPAIADVGSVYDLNGAPLVVPGSVTSGSGVIVSGGALVSGAVITPVAMSASGSAPVILPSPANSANSGLFVNEAGPSDMASLLTGLQDECVDVADAFTQGAGMVAGTLVSGSPPSGRICSTTTFTYTLRYGPYNDCAPRKSVNAATFQTVDTLSRGSSQSETVIAIEGCASPAALRVVPVKAITSAKGGYSWAMAVHADTEELSLPQGATGEVTYTLDVKRTGSKSGATLTADAFVTNPTAYPVVLEAVTYTATTMCEGFPKTTSGRVLCDGTSVPARGRLACRVAGGVPCPGNGAYTLVITTAGGLTITGNPTPFAFNMQQLGASNLAGACADVKDVPGADAVNGTLVSGEAPSGKICTSTSYKYTVRYGPFDKCGPAKAGDGYALSVGGSQVASASAALPIQVMGCNLYSDLTRAADCVRTAAWWATCSTDADSKCASGWKLLPGGRAKATLFFPKAAERSARTYASVLSPAGGQPTESRAAYASAAREYVAAELNYLSGARLPGAALQEAYDSVGELLATTGEGAGMTPDQVAGVRAQAELLARYNGGRLTGQGAPGACA
ncbi:hypothetical protein Rsub_00006 [Raphidocelis subcapitata]|uniref:Uncharacterized protein n=1 Tax=Raphidocelis subcapitata TaxID=307507 RepID=A0A2V0NR23_9CHLO|nr:hypothetical protein Rsub_00006 [Raphidocelis subcapitata]|eukprot:GBF87295.1 hypothetical protein Rsub_00006 [Raphidocelis subcapitata]